MGNEPCILIADDQNIIHETVGAYLKKEGFRCISAYDGEAALKLVQSENPDMIVLDLMMPKLSGSDVCREVRKTRQTPIIMLTAKGEEIDRIIGLELGADDYMVKPFSPRELVARIKAIFRRSMPSEDREPENRIILDGLLVDMVSYEVRAEDTALSLTPRQVEIMYLLASAPGHVFTREQILSKVWGYDFFGDTRAVDTQIKRIRQILPDGMYKWEIRTVYGVGYKLEQTGI